MKRAFQVWVVDDDRSIRWVLEKALQKASIQTRAFSTANSMMEALNRDRPDAVLTDIRMPGLDGIELLKQLQAKYPDLPVVIMTAHSDLESAVSAFSGGAFEYLPKPFDVDEAVDLVARACTHSQRAATEEASDKGLPEKTPEIIGEAPAMQEVFRAIARLARSNITVLINGESGTGKELVARALHRHSPRADKPFIALNMAAIPRDLLESELFGHERGAFTGAQARRAGRFEQADGGTLFLDEIGDMPAELQTRLLRVLAEGEFFPVGAHAPVKVDVRIIAATHQNLEQLVAEGRFREDLFHRLNVIRIHIPPLRERRQDVSLLLKHFLKEASQELNVETKTLLPEVEAYLCRLDWPGNVRQLENTCRWITVMAAGKDVHLDDLPPELLKARPEPVAVSSEWQDSFTQWIDARLRRGDRNVAKEAIDSAEGILISTALQFTRGRRQEAAKLLGYGRNTLTRKISELNLDV
ncbi:nitrogen regulation protein NR(I) [Methylococcus geothermalis]|uniref:DNA-binding transcriptional regulator NtrC n=1 Tax=Methylococcus geothermalis TaxID=2681310 RepID=A0A858QC15_9GAMM|nr:nitrogen regulation protein NR(I) [Methylococcus geothermalis]QJD31245.1 nitrogen regulation protein NR(I) [Methylococcus geothermalis]